MMGRFSAMAMAGRLGAAQIEDFWPRD